MRKFWFGLVLAWIAVSISGCGGCSSMSEAEMRSRMPRRAPEDAEPSPVVAGGKTNPNQAAAAKPGASGAATGAAAGGGAAGGATKPSASPPISSPAASTSSRRRSASSQIIELYSLDEVKAALQRMAGPEVPLPTTAASAGQNN